MDAGDSVAKESRPASTLLATSASKPGSKIGIFPFWRSPIFAASLSIQVTTCPKSEKHAPDTSPTEPVPIIAIHMKYCPGCGLWRHFRRVLGRFSYADMAPETAASADSLQQGTSFARPSSFCSLRPRTPSAHPRILRWTAKSDPRQGPFDRANVGPKWPTL